MRRRLPRIAFVGLLVGALVTAPGGAGATVTPGPGYLTISFGRTQWVATANCLPIANAVPLDQVAADMASRGMAGTGNVIVDRTRETGFLCVGYYMDEPGWDRLAMLRDTYGWSFVSASKTYADITTLTASQQQDESCGTLAAFEAHGHTRAWGLFAYARNKSTTTIQSQLVSTCFAYGRRYGRTVNSRSTVKAPWFTTTDDVTGGRCNDTTLPCSSLADVTRIYRSPVDLAAKVNVAPDTWRNLQFYRLVTGTRGTTTGKGQRWDCSGADWHAHWTSRPEVYCYNDFLSVLDAVPDAVVVTDPAGVATAWGRVPPFS
jgi:hypothetical protein